MKTNLAVIFGCRTVEHEVSIISAVQAMHSLDKEKYNIIPLYVTKSGETYTGDSMMKIDDFKNIDTLLKKSSPVSLIKSGDQVFVHFLDK